MGRFAALEEKAGRCSNVATLNNIRQENDAVKIRCLNEITAAEAKLLEQQAQTSQSPAATAPLSGQPMPAPAPKPKVKAQRTISIRSVNVESTWRLETPADVQRYVQALGKRLLDTLDEDTIVNVEF